MEIYVPLIRTFAARLVFFHSAIAAMFGLNATDLHSLRLLGERSMSAGDLSHQLGLTGAAVTALLDRLERAGYVVRERETLDRRRITVHADPEKLREVDRVYAAQGERMKKLLSRYSADDFRVITHFLDQTARVLAEETDALKQETAEARGNSDALPKIRESERS